MKEDGSNRLVFWRAIRLSPDRRRRKAKLGATLFNVLEDWCCEFTINEPEKMMEGVAVAERDNAAGQNLPTRDDEAISALARYRHLCISRELVGACVMLINKAQACKVQESVHGKLFQSLPRVPLNDICESKFKSELASQICTMRTWSHPHGQIPQISTPPDCTN